MMFMNPDHQMIRKIPMDGTAVVSARSIALRWGTVLQWEFGATPDLTITIMIIILIISMITTNMVMILIIIMITIMILINNTSS